MSMIQRSPIVVSAFAAVLVFALCAPVAVDAEDQVVTEGQVVAVVDQDPALAPAPASWDETSGYGSVEASRAAASTLLAPSAGPSWDDTSGYGSVETSRAAASALLASVAGPSWDETSGYGSVEASRVANAMHAAPAVVTAQVAADVRWAPTRPAWLAASRAAAARRAAPDFPEWDAARWSPRELVHPTSPDDLSEPLARGTRSESALLWSILHPMEDALDVALADCSP